MPHNLRGINMSIERIKKLKLAREEFDFMSKAFKNCQVSFADFSFCSKTLQRLEEENYLIEYKAKEEEEKRLKESRKNIGSSCCYSNDIFYRANPELFPDELNHICNECDEDCEIEEI
jgi:hypothetical protein